MFERKRPQFLQVLCILSFIACGIMLLFGLYGLKNLFMTPEQIVDEMSSRMMQQMPSDSYDQMIANLQYKNISAVCGVLFPLLSLTGVILMWNLKKKGFYIYTAAELLPYVVMLATTGTNGITAASGLMQNFQSVIYVVMGLVVLFDLLFIVLYALNLKHMS